MAAAGKNRLLKEISAILKSPPEGVTVVANEKDIHSWQADIVEPQGSPYGTLHLDIKIPNEYPFKGPDFYITPKITHPNVNDEDGRICTDAALGKWAPSIKMATALEKIREFFSHPPPEIHE